ncbi:ArnT family glycosyltransferase [Labilibaculum euxinus]
MAGHSRFGISFLFEFIEEKCSILRDAVYSRFTILLAFHFLIVILRILYVQLSSLEIYSEEAQYWIWSRHLQLSYYSKPPLIAYLNWFSTSLLGNTPLGIRINAILIGFGIAMTCYYLTLELFHNRRTAAIASFLSYVLPFIWLPSSFFTTDSPLLLFWLLSLFLFWRAVNNNFMKNWIYFGICLGLGIISKYSILLILPCLFVFLLRSHSHVFRSRKLYVGVSIGLLFFLPVVIWNIKNDFVGLRHVQYLAGNTKEAVQIEKLAFNFLEYIFGQIVILSPFFIGFYIKILKSWIHKQLSDEMVYLILPGIMVFFVFMPIAFVRRSGVEVNWPMFAYATIPVALAHWAVTGKKTGRLGAGVAATFMLVLLITNLSVLDKVGIQKIIHVKLDPTSRLAGWKSLAQHVDSLKRRIPSTNCFVFSNNYHISSEMQFYLEEQPATYFLNYNNRMNQFSLWPGLEQFVNKKYYGIFISTTPIKDKLKDSFEEMGSFTTRKTLYRGTEINNFNIYVLKDFKGFEENNSHY